jgi:hypothetical protein
VESRTNIPEASKIGEPEIVLPDITGESKGKYIILASLEIEISSLDPNAKKSSPFPSQESKVRNSLPQKQKTEDWSHVPLAEKNIIR